MTPHPRFVASDFLRDAAVKHGIRLEVLVADTALWANPEVHRQLVTDGSTGAFFPNRRRVRLGQGERRGQVVGTITLDDNSYANVAIKRAIGIRRTDIVGFEAAISGH